MSYAEAWADAINETYEHADESLAMRLEPGEDYLKAEKRALTKAAECLRNSVPATFTAFELDAVRHLMPAHEVDQSGAVRWVLDRYAN